MFLHPLNFMKFYEMQLLMLFQMLSLFGVFQTLTFSDYNLKKNKTLHGIEKTTLLTATPII